MSTTTLSRQELKQRKQAFARTYATKPRLSQRIVAEKMLANGGKASKAIREAGYSEAMARNPQKITKSKGFRQIANEIGLTDDYVLDCLKEDIQMKPQNRLGELTLVSKIKGMLTEASGNTTNILVLPQGLIEKNNQDMSNS
jgi:2-hydroxychromene-2-carboxylate isomerase